MLPALTLHFLCHVYGPATQHQANLAFCSKLIKSIAPIPVLGPKTWLLTSAGVSTSFVSKAESTLKGAGTTIASMRNGRPPDGLSKGDVVIFVSPNGRGDYRIANEMAKSGDVNAVVLVNGLAKVSASFENLF